MIVVSNTSPLINLARIGRLDLLHQLYGEVLLPEAVWQETVINGTGQAGADEIRTAAWVKIQAVSNQPMVRALRQELDAGEAEAIVLALESRADLLLMDERLGRETAQHLGLRYVGLIGVLIAAKSRGLIGQIKPELNALREVAGFFVDDTLYVQVLKDAGEI
jgi:predicted nucleic acid-binding protein